MTDLDHHSLAVLSALQHGPMPLDTLCRLTRRHNLDMMLERLNELREAGLVTWEEGGMVEATCKVERFNAWCFSQRSRRRPRSRRPIRHNDV